MDKNRVQFLNIDVLTASKKRLRELLLTFDNIAIAFSGGKDSLACVNIAQMVYNELNIKEKLNVFFRDEELIPDDVINFVQTIYKSGIYNFKYFAYPSISEKYIMGKKEKYVQWDINRAHIRPIPDFAITDKTKVLSQYEQDDLIAQHFGFKGKTCFITGVRTSESLIRFASIMAKKNKAFVSATKSKSVYVGKIIYDWSEKDIFRFFYENKIKYCDIYNNQIFNNQPLRVSTPLHAEASKQIGKLKTLYPVFYNQLYSLFPEIEIQSRYFNEFDRYGIMLRYEHSWRGIMNYINDYIDEDYTKEIAIKRVKECIRARRNKIKQGATNLGGYPILHVFKQIVNGSYKRHIQPISNPSKQMLDYEAKI